MRALIAVAPKPLASALMTRTLQSTGLQSQVYALDGQGEAQVAQDLEALLATIPPEYGLVILTDAASSYCTTGVMAGLEKAFPRRNDVLILSGVNVPMTTSAVMLRDMLDTTKELAESLLAEGRASMSRIDV